MKPRGIRNNNPGNIRVGQPWRGLARPEERTPEQLAEFEYDVFIAPIYGIRAMSILLLNYQHRHQLATIYAIVARYAPASENNVIAYADHVAQRVGINIHDMIDLDEPAEMRSMLTAMILHENGIMPYTHEIGDAMTLAFNT